MLISVRSARIIAEGLKEAAAKKGKKARRVLVKKWTGLHWWEFLFMVGHPGRDYGVSWKQVLRHKKKAKDASLGTTIAGALSGHPKEQTLSRIRKLRDKGYPDEFLKAIFDKDLGIGLSVNEVYLTQNHPTWWADPEIHNDV